jgi:CO/xanthine dehydrogenase Mo-binding subunit
LIRFDQGDDEGHWRDVYRNLTARPQESNERLRYVGKSVPRGDVLHKVRGKAGYAANYSMPGMLHGRFLRSRYPHARIRNIDLDAARRAPGVVCILSAGDLPEDRQLVGPLVQDTPIFAKEVVRYVGEPIAVVAAETLEAADAALELISVDYEPLPPVLTSAEALSASAPKLHPKGNITVEHRHAVGDVDAAFAAADVIIDGEYEVLPIEHCHLEPHAGLAFVDSTGVLTLLVPQQYPHYQHRQLARITGLPMDKVHVIPTAIGGAFGGKNDVTIECALCLLTLRTGRPIKMALDREEVFTSTIKRHAMTIRHRLGANKDGRITSIDIDILCDGGAYSSYSAVVAERCLIHAAMPYDVPNIRAHVTTTFTNNAPAGAMRSFGVVKLAFATESQINKLAWQLGLSPIVVRRLNAVRNGSRGFTGQVLRNAAFIETLDAIEPIYESRRRELAAWPTPSAHRRGLGIACLGYGIGYTGRRNPSRARIEATPAGDVLVFCGTPDVGTGSDTVMAQIAAEIMDVDLGRVRVTSGDSITTADSGPTSASRTTYFSGNAVRFAAERFRQQFLDCAATAYGVPQGELRLEEDQLLVRNEAIPFPEACRKLGEALTSLNAEGICDPEVALDTKTMRGDIYPTYGFATHMAEVDVDTDTGQVRVPRYWAAHDAGTVVNPVGAEGQVEGGIVMGLGMALWEKVVRSEGFIQNPSYRDYLLPGSRDVPERITSIFVRNQETSGPFGAKGVAEPSIVPVPAAVAAGIREAVGVLPAKLPMEAQTVLALLNEQTSSKVS